jgi:predicted HAD superfamily Cof-like phosphohydrolase
MALFHDLQQDVADFHYKTHTPVGVYPKIPSEKIKELRKELIGEEAKEVLEAIENDDLVKIADGLVDLVYVIVGTAIAYGIDLTPVWAVVHRANMEKVREGIKSESGKVLKPDGWKSPESEIKQILISQGRWGVHYY